MLKKKLTIISSCGCLRQQVAIQHEFFIRCQQLLSEWAGSLKVGIKVKKNESFVQIKVLTLSLIIDT